MPIALRDTEMDVAQVIESATITGINYASGSLFAGPMLFGMVASWPLPLAPSPRGGGLCVLRLLQRAAFALSG